MQQKKPAPAQTSNPTGVPQVVSADWSNRTLSLGKIVVLLLACIHLVIATQIVTNRLTHAAYDNADAVHGLFCYEAGEGMPLYGKYTPHTEPLNYTPLTLQTVGFISRWFDYDIRAMRAVIAFFGVGSMVLIGLIAYRLTRNRYMSLIAALLFCGIDVGPWYVTLIPDPMHVFFALLGVLLLIRDEKLSWSTAMLATLAFFACFWSKHTGLAYLAAGMFYMLVRDWRKGLAAMALAAVLVLGFCGYYATRPGSTFLAAMLGHGNDPMNWSSFLTPVLFPSLLGRFGLLVAVVVAGLAGNGLKLGNWLKPQYILLGAATVVGLVTQLKYGSGGSQAIVLYGMIICLGVAFLYEFIKRKSVSGAMVLAILAVQSVALIHPFANDLITDDDDARFQQVLEVLRTPGKSVYYNPGNGFLNRLVGKQIYGNAGQSCWYKGQYDRSRMPAERRAFWDSDPFDIVMIDVPLEDNSWLLYDRLNVAYKAVQEIPASASDYSHSLRFKKVIFERKGAALGIGAPTVDPTIGGVGGTRVMGP